MDADHADGRRLGVIPVNQRKSATSVETAFFFEAASGWLERHGNLSSILE